ncbi:hypothetical protein [Streptomyces sp. NPDC002676]
MGDVRPRPTGLREYRAGSLWASESRSARPSPRAWTAAAHHIADELARGMILRALASALPIAWVTGDCT